MFGFKKARLDRVQHETVGAAGFRLAGFSADAVADLFGRFDWRTATRL